MKKHSNVSIFIPHKGCPNDCIFCNQKRISNTLNSPNKNDIVKILDEGIATLGEKSKYAQIAFFGGSFTAIDRPLMIKYLEIAKKYIDNGLYHSVRISTRPDFINDEILAILKYYGVLSIELGVQSMDDKVLDFAKRGHTSSDVIRASKLIKKYGFELGHQMMVGLPLDSGEKAIQTAKKLLKLSPDTMRIYPVLVIRDTYLEKLFYDGKYIPINIDKAADICSEIIKLMNEKNVQVIRLGLHSDESLTNGSSVVAGPFHPSFGEIVQSKLYYMEVCSKIDESKGIFENSNLLIAVGMGCISKMIGNKKTNILKLKHKYRFNDIKVIEQTNLQLFEVNISIL